METSRPASPAAAQPPPSLIMLPLELKSEIVRWAYAMEGPEEHAESVRPFAGLQRVNREFYELSLSYYWQYLLVDGRHGSEALQNLLRSTDRHGHLVSRASLAYVQLPVRRQPDDTDPDELTVFMKNRDCDYLYADLVARLINLKDLSIRFPPRSSWPGPYNKLLKSLSTAHPHLTQLSLISGTAHPLPATKVAAIVRRFPLLTSLHLKRVTRTFPELETDDNIADAVSTLRHLETLTLQAVASHCLPRSGLPLRSFTVDGCVEVTLTNFISILSLCGATIRHIHYAPFKPDRGLATTAVKSPQKALRLPQLVSASLSIHEHIGLLSYFQQAPLVTLKLIRTFPALSDPAGTDPSALLSFLRSHETIKKVEVRGPTPTTGAESVWLEVEQYCRAEGVSFATSV